jgi:putative peptidoglycan lipid II flippase
VPVATATFPTVATAHATGDRKELGETVSRTGRAVVLLSCLGAAVLVAVAQPLSDLFIRKDHAQATSLASAIIAFAPGLVGYGLSALHQRTLYAVGAQRFAAIGIGLGWLVTIGASFALSAALPLDQRPNALGAANSIGMTVLGIALAAGVFWRAGKAALAGLSKVVIVGVVGAALAALAGLAVQGRPETTPAIWVSIGQGMLSAGVAAVVFALVAVATRVLRKGGWA